MEYIRGKIFTTEEGTELVSLMLVMRGIEQFSIEGPEVREEVIINKEKLLWDFLPDQVENEETVITFYLDIENIDIMRDLQSDILTMRSRNDYAKERAIDLGRLYLEIDDVDDAAWKDKWKEHYKATKISDSFVVKPTWQNISEKELQNEFANCKIIEMDPGMAFGTGTHETTSMCIRLMEDYGCEGKTILDVGTGSGILAIAAAKLGAIEILGVDIDRDAVKVAEENIKINGNSGEAKAVYGDLTKGIDIKVDVVVGNLISSLVIFLSESVKKHMKEGGIFIASGILIEQKDDVVEKLWERGLILDNYVEDGEWCAIAVKG